MTRERWIVVGVLALAAAGTAVYYAGRPAEQVRFDLIQQLDAVEKRPASPPPGEWCRPREIMLAGERKLAVAVLPSSRLTWKLTVPPKAVLRVWIGLEPDVWDREGDGVVFRIGVSEGGSFRDLVVRQVNPLLMSGHRKWVPVTVDLSAYEGLQLSLLFNTNASAPGRGDDTRNDKPVWGAPAIITAQ